MTITHYKIVLLLGLLLGITPLIFSQIEPLDQASKVDSVWAKVKEKNQDQVMAQNVFFPEMKTASRSQDTLLMFKLLEKLKTNSSNDEKWTPSYHHRKGMFFFTQKSYSQAVNAFRESSDFSRQIEDEEWLYEAQSLDAWSLERTNEIEAALTIYENLEKELLYKADGRVDTVLLINAMVKLAYASYIKNDYIDALIRSQSALNIAQLSRDTFNMQRTLNFLTEIQDFLGEKEAKTKYKEFILTLHEAKSDDFNKVQALQLRIECAESKEDALTYFNQIKEFDEQGRIGELHRLQYLYTYATWLEEHVSYTEAFPINQQLIQLFDTDCSHRVSFYWTKNAMLHYYFESGQYQVLVKEARSLLDCVASRGDLALNESVYSLLSEAFNQLNQVDSAYNYLKKSLVMKDSANVGKKPEQVMKVMLLEQFEQEKEVIRLQQEKEQVLVTAQLKEQKIFLMIASIGSVLLLIIALLFYNNFQVQRKANAVLSDYSKRLEMSNRKLDRFASGVSHDILAKLNLVLSMGNIMVQNKEDLEPLLGFYDKSMDAIRRVRNYCVALLETAQLQNKEIVEELAYDPNTVLKRALEDHKDLIEQYKVEVSATNLAKLPMAETDLLQVFQNLIRNALTFLQGQENAKLEILTQTSKDQYSIGFLDNGPGIPIELREKVFEHGVSYAQSSGLGLSIVKSLMEEVGGQVLAKESTLGGAAIWMHFPRPSAN